MRQCLQVRMNHFVTLLRPNAMKAGLPPHFPFEGGSFANGGAMRISPLAVAFRNAPPQQLRFAVREAICSSHAHPEV